MNNRKRKWVFIIVIPLVVACVVTLIPFAVRSYVVQAYKIPSGAMRPTLLVGDHILVDKNVRNIDALTRKDIIVFEFPVDPSKDFVKRLMGLPGDTIEIIDKELFVNGILFKEIYIIHADEHIYPSDAQSRDNLGPIKVPDDHLFVMGDNRDQSFDSRFWGFVEVSKVKGKVTSIYWSWDKENSHVRWDRIGDKVN